jgi:hypothetical protein
MHQIRRVQHILDLVKSRKRPPIEKNHSLRTPLQQIPTDLQHDLHTKIILPRGVFDFFFREQAVPNFVFAQHAPLSPRSQLPRERSLASAGQSSHDYEHDSLNHLQRDV